MRPDSPALSQPPPVRRCARCALPPSGGAQGVLERPEQLFDTSCCGKLYRRQFLVDNGLQFPAGILYEDLLFTTQAYCSARTIAVVPDLVYVWNVRRDANAPSITNQLDLRRWRDRFDVNRRIDAYLAGRPEGARLRTAKDRKFLDVDVELFLRELRTFRPAHRAELLALAGDYVTQVDRSALGDCRLASRLGALLTGQNDLERTLVAADFSRPEASRAISPSTTGGCTGPRRTSRAATDVLPSTSRTPGCSTHPSTVRRSWPPRRRFEPRAPRCR